MKLKDVFAWIKGAWKELFGDGTFFDIVIIFMLVGPLQALWSPLEIAWRNMKVFFVGFGILCIVGLVKYWRKDKK